jgi:hypothetical protein
MRIINPLRSCLLLTAYCLSSKGGFRFAQLLTAYCLLFPAYSQLSAQAMLFPDDPDCARTEMPASWEKYSSVILASVQEYDFSQTPAVEKIRVRVKLQDKASVEEYGELRLDEGEEWFIQLLKPDGAVIKIDPSQAVTISASETDQAGWKWGERGQTETQSFRKLAIPNIEVGDILDLSVRMDLPTENLVNLLTSVSMVVLTDGYPVGTRKLRFRMPDFDTDPEFRLLFKSLNGAPEIEEVAKEVYEFADHDREPLEPELWSISSLGYPTIKYGMLYVAPELLGVYENNDQQLLQNLNASKLPAYAHMLASFSEGKSVQLRKFLKKTRLFKAKSQEEKEELLQEHFYLRRFYVRGDYADFYVMPYEVLFRMGIAREKQVWNYEEFPFLVGGELVSMQANLDLPPLKTIMILPRSIPDLAQALSPSELVLGYMLESTTGDSVYLVGVNPERRWGEINFSLEGGKAYAIEPLTLDRNKEKPLSSFQVPFSSEAENRVQDNLSVDLSQPRATQIQETYVVTGNAQRRFDYVLYGEDLLAPERERYGEILGKMGERYAPSPSELDQLDEYRRNRIRSELEDDFGQVELKEVTVLQAGRHHSSPELIFTWTFEAPDLVKKAGPNYLFEIGKLITSQILIEQEDRERTGDIYMEYARSYFHDISIQLPAGYTVEGLDELNELVDNPAGQFSVSARQEGGELLLSVRKIYKSATVAREDWSGMLAFLDAAHAFTQKKVLLRKK